MAANAPFAVGQRVQMDVDVVGWQPAVVTAISPRLGAGRWPCGWAFDVRLEDGSVKAEVGCDELRRASGGASPGRSPRTDGPAGHGAQNVFEAIARDANVRAIPTIGQGATLEEVQERIALKIRGSEEGGCDAFRTMKLLEYWSGLSRTTTRPEALLDEAERLVGLLVALEPFEEQLYRFGADGAPASALAAAGAAASDEASLAEARGGVERWPANLRELSEEGAWPAGLAAMLQPTATDDVAGRRRAGLPPFRIDTGGEPVHAASGVGLEVNKEASGPGVMLNTRVAPRSALHRSIQACARQRGIERLCPKAEWRRGPVGCGPPSGALRAGAADPRFYLITGWMGGYTPAHVDSGSQVVLYHMAAGVNIFVGCSPNIAAILWGLREGCDPAYTERIQAIENSALLRLAARGKLQYAEIRAGESILILPNAGHTVLTGDFKVVLAGEWHWKMEDMHEDPTIPVARPSGKRARAPSADAPPR